MEGILAHLHGPPRPHVCSHLPQASIPADTHIVVAHGPADGHVDGGHGCASLAAYLAKLPDLRLVVSGHIHEAHGVETTAGGTVYVNAAICRGGYRPGWPAEVVDL